MGHIDPIDAAQIRYGKEISLYCFVISFIMLCVSDRSISWPGSLMSHDLAEASMQPLELTIRPVTPDKPRFPHYEQAEQSPDRARGQGQGRWQVLRSVETGCAAAAAQYTSLGQLLVPEVLARQAFNSMLEMWEMQRSRESEQTNQKL